MKRLFLFFTILICSVHIVNAQKFTASADHTSVPVGGTLQVSFTVSDDNGTAFQPPAFNGFRILSGPNISNSININGRMTISNSFSYVLQAVKSGKLIIPPAS